MQTNHNRRYRDKDRSSSPADNPNAVTATPTFKAFEEKKQISVKAVPKAVSGVASATKTVGAKKIDMGAASNYGKGLGINSPTHRNTHNEDLFGSDSNVNTTTITKSKSDIDNIFSENNDDFNPRAGESSTTADFGDFESAFGANNSRTTTAQTAPIAIESNDFADFSSAFAGPAKPAPASLEDDSFLFNAKPAQFSQPIATTTPINPTSNLLNADLFGNSVITNAFASPTSPTAGNNKDLLSDFGDLTLNSMPQGNSLMLFCINFSLYLFICMF
jgi:hypothetical protein